jgi:hypothetical protein
MSLLQCLTGFNKPWEQTKKNSGSMTSQIELIKTQVLDRLADAADPLLQVMVDNGTGLKEFESATFGMLLQVGIQLLKRFGQQLSIDTLEKVSRQMGHPAAEFMHQKPATPADEEG